MFLTAFVLAGCSNDRPEYLVTQGLVTISGMEEFARRIDEPGVEAPVPKLKATKVIHKPIEGLGGLGFRIQSSPEHTYTVHTIQRLPGIPPKLSGPERISFDQETGILTVKTKEVEVAGGRYFYWKPAPEDPVGEYSIDIYVDGELLETISFEVRDK